MVQLRCPRCAATFAATPGVRIRCPSCRYDGGLAPGGPTRRHEATMGMPILAPPPLAPPFVPGIAPKSAAAPAGDLRSKLAAWAFACALAPFVTYLLSALFSMGFQFGDSEELPAGLLALQGLASILGLGGPIAAIALGIAARRDPRIRQGSRNLALAAIIIGAITLGLYVVALLFVLLLVLACASACGSLSALSGPATASSLPCASLVVTTPGPGRGGRWHDAFSHHPDLPALRADVFRVAGLRLCAGCFTVYPTFAAASLAVWIWPVPSMIAWTAGFALAAAQGFSTAGLTVRRWHKVVVKACLGIGGALLLRVVLEAPWPDEFKSLALAAGGLAALASTRPRLQRIARLGVAPA